VSGRSSVLSRSSVEQIADQPVATARRPDRESTAQRDEQSQLVVDLAAGATTSKSRAAGDNIRTFIRLRASVSANPAQLGDGEEDAATFAPGHQLAGAGG
jgi:hypothetical protein